MHGTTARIRERPRVGRAPPASTRASTCAASGPSSGRTAFSNERSRCTSSTPAFNASTAACSRRATVHANSI
ncbi:hypothetical protein [Parafrankia soli]|uniref:hypothetical protein n=1 Tax=Parafrankia soli TaxID=2599596 RepID=UPI001F51B2B7|nr:hypothetical protein [Parafrankia soli]